MIVEGERIKALVSQAKSDVLLCSPFIKKNVIGTLLDVIPEQVSIVIVTRWRPAEVAAGLSDLEVFDLAKERPRTEVRLLHQLHAKLYIADDDCLLGSANLTATGLGWHEHSNLEILIPAQRTDADVEFLLSRLESATPATFQLRDEMEQLAASIDASVLDEAKDISATTMAQASTAWLPRCAAPDKLYDIYQNPSTAIIVESTRADAQADLNDLLLPTGLSREKFSCAVAATVSRIPSFRAFLDRVPAGLTDAEGERLVSDLRPGTSEADVRRHWYIVRQWISVFFQDTFEVAPQSFIVRLRSR